MGSAFKFYEEFLGNNLEVEHIINIPKERKEGNLPRDARDYAKKTRRKRRLKSYTGGE